MKRFPLAARAALMAGMLAAHHAGAQAPAVPGAAPPAPPAPAPAAPPAPAAEAAPAATQPDVSEQLRALEARIEELEAAQATAEVENLTQTTALPSPDKFNIYGFADFGLNHAWVGDNSFLNDLVSEDTTFVLGNLNLYFDFKPDPSWQVLTEIRFTSYPHGVEEGFATPLGGEYLRVDTEVVDVASPATSSQFRWGGIFIERAYADWSYDERFNVRVGQFLTPYGIWNVDHGTPTLIALMVPHFVASEVFPARQLGIQLHGAFLSAGWELGYAAYVSNGRTATQLDVTENKAFGGRLSASRIAPLPLTLGTSFYYGQVDDITKTIVRFAPFEVRRDLVLDGTEWGLGVDLSLDIDALRLRAEGLMRQQRYEAGKRPERRGSAPGSRLPDNNEYDGYLLAAYRLPWLGLEPFGYGEVNHFVSPFGDEQAVLALGLNIHLSSFAQIKTEVARVLFLDVNSDDDYSANNMTLLFSRLAVAF